MPRSLPPPDSTFDAITAGSIVTAAMGTFFAASMAVPIAFALPAGQLALVVVPVVTMLAMRRRPRVLGLRGCRARYVVAAVLVGATAWYLNTRLVELIDPPGDTHVLEELIDRPSLVVALGSFALLPAMCEELVFRGVFARSLGRQLPLAAAAAISALVFSAYHLSLVQAAPTFTLGLAFAVIAIRADSIIPTMIGHALNNAIAIAVSRGQLATISNAFARHPGPALAGCAFATVAGLALALDGRS